MSGLASRSSTPATQVYNSLQGHWDAEKTFTDRKVVFEQVASIIDASLGDYFGIHLVHKHDDIVADNEVVVHRGRVAQPEPFNDGLFPMKWTRDGHAYEFTVETVPGVDKQVLASIKEAIPSNNQVGLFYLTPELREPNLQEILRPGKYTHTVITEEEMSNPEITKLETAWCRVKGEWTVAGAYLSPGSN